MIPVRQNKLRRKMRNLEVDGFITRSPENRRYLTGFSGSEGWVLVFETKTYLVVDFRYVQQAKFQAPHCEIVKMDTTWLDTIVQLIPIGCRGIGFEADLTYEDWDRLSKAMSGTRMIPTSNVVEELRVQKDEKELDLMRRAIEIADLGVEYLNSELAPGKTEKEVALGLEVFLRKKGADGPAFPFIVASGSRGSLPHGVASDKTLENGDLVTVDFGAKFQGYHSDLTRTFALGKATDKQRLVYEIVLKAQFKAISAAGPGIPCADVDRAARDYISKAGYGAYFGHATGHGIGLSIHEEPRLSINANVKLMPGMVITVEPGIYLPGWGGVRIEDNVLITHQGIEVLSTAPKEMFVL